MAAKSTSYANDILNLVLNGTPISGIADNAASSPLTDLYVALHTASPGSSGTQATNEATYTGYARVAVSRSNTTPAWNVANESASLNATIAFPAATAGSETETYFSIGSAATGGGVLFYYGPITPTIAIAAGVTPELTTDTTISES